MASTGVSEAQRMSEAPTVLYIIPQPQAPQQSSEEEIETNPIKRLYDNALGSSFGRWLSAIIVLGLSAGVLSKTSSGPLHSAAAYNLAVATVHFFPLGPFTKPISPTNPRPPYWYIIVLAFSTATWVTAFSVMFAMLSGDDTYEVFSADKRSLISIGTGVLAMLENITIACGCMGVSAFIFCLCQWYFVCRLVTDKFSEQEIREAYEKMKSESEKSKENNVREP